MDEFNNQYKVIWILALILSEIILLFLPIYVYDKHFWAILIPAIIVQYVLINRIERVVLKKKKLTGLVFLILLFAITNFFVYDYRKENAFKNNELITTTGIVKKTYRQGGGKTSKRYYLEYEFTANFQKYTHVDQLRYWVWFNYKLNDSLKVEYVIDNPRISRIDKSSMIEYPEQK